jgi:TRAP-type C4-dicarboxylate transport system permease small subunit
VYIRRYTDVAFEAMTAFLLITMVVLTLLQVVTRYGLHAGFEWTEELARLDLIYLTFFGSIVAFQRREHLRIETLVHLLPPSARRCLRVMVDLASMVVLGVVVWQGVPLLKRFWPLLSAALSWPTTFFYFPVVFGCFVMLIYAGLDVIAALRGQGEQSGEGEKA